MQSKIEKALDNLDRAITKYYLSELVSKGGAGSGHWSHAGRRGERGGSARGKGGARNYKKETPEIRKKKLLNDAFNEIEQRNPDAMREVRYWDGLVKDGYTSANDNKREDGQFTTQRQALHDKIINKYTNIVKTGEKPKLILFGGAAGSGKGGLKRMLGSEAEKFNYVNNDDIKAELPEYNGRNSAYLHDEASVLVEKIKDKLAEQKANIIIDGTLKTKSKGVDLIDRFHNEGYEVELMSTNIPLEETIQRNLSRFLDEGQENRYVPLELVVESSEKANINQFELLDYVDKGAIYDTNVERGQPYKLIKSKGE